MYFWLSIVALVFVMNKHRQDQEPTGMLTTLWGCARVLAGEISPLGSHAGYIPGQLFLG